MLMPNAPHTYRVLHALRYGNVPGVPLWDAPLFLDLLLPEPRPDRPVPAVVYIHGGGWRSGDMSAGMYPWHSPLLAANGFVAVNVGYRLTDLAPFPAQIHDAKAAIRWLRANAGEYGIDVDRIGVWGDSAGGHLASLLGVTGDDPEFEGECGSPGESTAVQAVIARCAPSDFTVRDMEFQTEYLEPLFGGPWDERSSVRRLASPAVFAHGDLPPFFVVHGTEDETVPFGQAERFVGALRANHTDVIFHVVPGGRHSLVPEDDQPWGNDPWTELGRQALSFFDRTLRADR